MTIEISQSHPQVGGVYVIDQQTIEALGVNFQKEQVDKKPEVYATKPDDIDLPPVLKFKPKYTPDPNPKHKGSLSQGHQKQYMNRRLHQDNTRVN